MLFDVTFFFAFLFFFRCWVVWCQNGVVWFVVCILMSFYCSFLLSALFFFSFLFQLSVGLVSELCDIICIVLAFV